MTLSQEKKSRMHGICHFEIETKSNIKTKARTRGGTRVTLKMENVAGHNKIECRTKKEMKFFYEKSYMFCQLQLQHPDNNKLMIRKRNSERKRRNPERINCCGMSD